MGEPVILAVYDITRGMARALSRSLVGKQLDGVWHTGVIVYGHEYFWGSGGIATCLPNELPIGPPDQKIEIGRTEIPYEVFHEYLEELAQDAFRGDRYHLIDKNCNNFSNEVCQFLTGNPIPDHIVGLPAEVMATPFGQMIRPMIDGMMTQINGMTHIGTTPISEGLPTPNPQNPRADGGGSENKTGKHKDIDLD